MQTPKKARPLYSLSATADRRYAHLSLEILIPGRWRESNHDSLLSVTWQTHAADSTDYPRSDPWYGCTVKMEFSASGDVIPEIAAKAAAMLRKLLPENQPDSPAALVARLDALKIERGVYDSRLSRHIPITDALPAEWSRWMDGARGTQCTVSAMARDEDEARRLLTKEFGAEIARGASISTIFADWMASGHPVRTSEFDSAPVITPTAELLRGPFTPAATETSITA